MGGWTRGFRLLPFARPLLARAGTKVMLVLLPDAQFEDDAEIEREVLGRRCGVSRSITRWTPCGSPTLTGGAPTR